ncbi:MAG: hypothetical protein HYS21_01595 [Deltaproteobacteria bacterium]|nr:hypothetical protein [Deltaproteobacteria bacterium]
MKVTKKLSVILLIFAVLTFSIRSTANAEDTMQKALTDSLYGGLVGALLGSALLLLTDNPDEHLSYIPTGAAVGILAGAAYGVATSGIVRTSAAEVENGKVTFNMPTIQREEIYDRNVDDKEVINRVELVKLKF